MAKKGFNKREQQVVLLAGCLGLLVLFLYVAYIIRPIRRESTELAGQVRTAQEKLQSLEAVVANEGRIREQHAQAEQAVLLLRSHLPAEGEVSQLIQLLTDWADRSQLKIQTISPQRPDAMDESESAGAPKAATPAVYEDIFIQIDALAGYHQLGKFLNLIESSDKPMHLSSLKIVGNSKEPRRSTIKLLLGTYLSKGASSMVRSGGAVR